MPTDFETQDTIKPQLVIRINADKLLPDSVFRKLDEIPEHIILADSLSRIRKVSRVPELIISDTTSVCVRNNIADVTFYDSLSFIRNLDRLPPVYFPYHYPDKTIQSNKECGTVLISGLRDGHDLPKKPLHHDWIIGIVFLAAYLWLLVRTASRRVFPEITRFIVLRGINESSSRDTGSLFTWQSTIMNFISFMIIGLFLFCIAEWVSIIPSGISHSMFMFLSLCLIILGITTRHFICIAAGNFTEETELFNEYLMNVYQSYRYASFFIFGIIILLLYTNIFPSRIFIVSGAIILIIFYLIRIIRLLLIFMKRKISLLYLILYLCALEILPILILIKYFSSLDLH
jgi:hypothetical protein